MGDFDADVFDHSNVLHPRRTLSAMSLAPAHCHVRHVPRSVKVRWGSDWKKAAIYWYDRWAHRICRRAHCLQNHFMDLDPTYKDHLGDPLLRMTIDWKDNERKMVDFAIAKGVNWPAPWARRKCSVGAAGTIRRRLSVHARAGRHDHGQIARSFGGQYLRAALADAESFRYGRVDFPQTPPQIPRPRCSRSLFGPPTRSSTDT